MTQDNQNCFTFEEVSFRWPQGRTVLDGQSFAVPRGVFALLRGPSGAGKSTLLRLMNRLEEPQSGAVYFGGRLLKEYDPPRLRQQVAYLHQMPVVPDLSVRQTLLTPFSYGVNKGLARPSDEELSAWLDKVLLGDVSLGESAAALSGGQRQRLCLLRGLMTKPEVLLLDEPTASLDSRSEAIVERMAEEQCSGGVTVVMVTHDGFSPSSAPALEIHIQEGKVEVRL